MKQTSPAGTPGRKEHQMLHQILSVNPVHGSLDGFEAVCSCGDRYRTSLSEHEARRQHADHARYMAAKAAKATRKRVA